MKNIKVHHKLFQAVIRQNHPLRRPGLQGNYHIQVELDQAVECKPGQFFKFDLTEQLHHTPLEIIEPENDHKCLEVKNISPSNEFIRRQPLIARPYSVGLCEQNNGKTLLTFLYKILGPGSQRLSELKAGTRLIVMGPLGAEGFYLPKNKKRALLVAGGVGLPPLLFLSQLMLKQSIESVHLFIGANTSDKLPLHADLADGKAIKNPQGLPDIFRHLADPRMTIRISTDDGSEGHKGLATQLLEQHLQSQKEPHDAAVFTCGPWRMMARTAEIAKLAKLPCQVCLEEMMGCGIGACQSCVTKVKSNSEKGWEFKLVCRDGPVFKADEIYWEK